MVSSVKETGESSKSKNGEKKSKKKAQYNCIVTCLDGTVIETSVDVCYISVFYTDFKKLYNLTVLSKCLFIIK